MDISVPVKVAGGEIRDTQTTDPAVGIRLKLEKMKFPKSGM